MTITINNCNEWVIATDAVGVFTDPVKLETDSEFATGQPYVVVGDTIEEVLAKVFSDATSYDEEIGVDVLTPKSSEDIIAEKY